MSGLLNYAKNYARTIDKSLLGTRKRRHCGHWTFREAASLLNRRKSQSVGAFL